MRLDVFHDGSGKEQVIYTISPKRRNKNGVAFPKDRAHFAELQPRIEKMARRLLGKWFIALRPIKLGVSYLRVKVGTSTAKRAELRDLFGWIVLFDSENDPAHERKGSDVVAAYVFNRDK